MAELEKKQEEGKQPKSKKDGKAAKKEKKPGIFSKAGKFLKDCTKELKKVVWFGKKQTINSTILVVIALIFFAAVIGVLDYFFSLGITALGNIY